MSAVSVAHGFEVWLPATMTWAYNQVRYVTPRQATQTVLAMAEVERERFPWSEGEIVVAAPGERRLVGAAARAGRRWYPRSWTKALAAAPPDVVYSHFGYRGWRDVPLARRFGAAHVVRFYGHDVDMFPDRWPKWRRRYAELFDAVDLVLSEGPAMAARLVERGCPAEKARVVRLGVELGRLACRPREVSGDGVVRFLVAAAFREKKGIPAAIAAFARVREVHPGVVLTIIGDAGSNPGESEEKQRILATIEEHRVADAVRLLGFTSYDRMLVEAYDHHVFLAPSITARDGDNEGGAPVTIVEMAATGMPVVATTHRDIPQAVDDGSSGLLAAEGDIDGLAERMARLAADPDLISSMGRAGRALAEQRFDVSVCAAALADVYREVGGGRDDGR